MSHLRFDFWDRQLDFCSGLGPFAILPESPSESTAQVAPFPNGRVRDVGVCAKKHCRKCQKFIRPVYADTCNKLLIFRICLRKMIGCKENACNY
jgi:hypothetical protein